MVISVGKAVARVSAPSRGVLHQSISLDNPADPQPAPDGVDERLSFWEELNLVPEDQWWSGAPGDKGYKVYLYDLEQGGKYLEVINHPFEIEWVKERRGGGLYRAQLNDPGGKITASIRFSVDGESKRKTNGQAPAPAASEGFQSQVLQIIQEGQRRQEALLERLMDRDRNTPAAPMANPMEVLRPVLEGVVSMFTNMIPKPSNPLDDMIKMKQLFGGEKDIWSEVSKLKEMGLIGGNGGNKDLLDQIGVVMAVAEKLNLGGGGGKSLTEIIADKAPEVIKAIREGITEYRVLEEKRLETAKVIASMQPPKSVQSAPFVPGPQPPAAALHSPTGQAPAPANHAPAAAPLQVEEIRTQGEQVTEAQINQVKAEIVQAIAAGVNGEDVFSLLKIKAPAFLNGMCFFDDKGNVTGVVSEEQLLMFCAADPVLSQAAKLPRYRETLRELLGELKYVALGEEEAPDARENV